MNNESNPIQDIRAIRSMVERSTRFISLSGLSGIAAGVSALLGAAMACAYLDILPFTHHPVCYYEQALQRYKWGMNYIHFFLLDAFVTLLLGLSGAFYFTYRKSIQTKQHIFDRTALRLAFNLILPLLAGGLFCLTMMYHGYFGLLAPATLLFYGLALLNASKYTLETIFYLAIAEIGLGICAGIWLGYGLEFWIMGFGGLHIIYGALMYIKYDK